MSSRIGNNNLSSNLNSNDNTDQEHIQNTVAGSNTQQPQSQQTVLPSLSLPKGGGAIRGMDEKFSVNPVTGTGSLVVPIFTSPGRSGFGPQLSLSYDSGSGNGLFGFGWSLSLPSITRKTSKGLPKYHDTGDDDESDTFILSGAEDLVPVLVQDENDKWQKQVLPTRLVSGVEYRINRYRPRIEGLFARIEQWTNIQTGETHWRSISKDNITTLYGLTDESRISDPSEKSKVFSWLICQSYDDKGNAMLYQYKEEDSTRVDTSQVHEKNRTEDSRSANRYLKRIKYGNRESRLVQPDLLQMKWMFEVVFDYGEHDQNNPSPDDSDKWLCRHDPFSSYKAGFEVRTYRLCQRVLMFHHFPEETGVGQDCLVRSTDFVYRHTRNNDNDLKKGHPIASFISSITQAGYRKRTGADSTINYTKKSLPPLEFEYSKPTIQDNYEIKEIDKESLENLPVGLDGANYQWVDLDGEGISGILTEQGDAWFYKHNLSSLPIQHKEDDDSSNNTKSSSVIVGRFGPVTRPNELPAPKDLDGGNRRLMDLAGDGQLDLVQLDRHSPGYYERTLDEINDNKNKNKWKSFIPFESIPNISWNDPNLRLVDLTGDGHADILITETQALVWHESFAEKGFAHAQKVIKTLDEEKGPALVFADGTQSIYLADISGDGLSDLVRIRQGEICYWPNLGYGKFGAKVTMDNSPSFDVTSELFNQQRVRLADIDGSGTADIIYLGHDDNGIRIYLNQSGNSWSDAHHIPNFPHIDNLSSVNVVDLLGNGTACIVWSSPLVSDTQQPMKYLDLMDNQKPHLLVSVKNNLGAETRIEYAPSTKFYLQDRIIEKKPWITRLPFPVHVVERVKTFDLISRNLFVTRYAYHHGYFDGIEREFRGFGMVEQFDTEEYDTMKDNVDSLFPSSSSSLSIDNSNIEKSSHVPPTLTKTWFHTGSFLQGDYISLQMAHEYYGAPSIDEPDYEQKFKDFVNDSLLPDTVLPKSTLTVAGRKSWNLGVDERRQACRALKGSVLRQEVYALDDSPQSIHPYNVSEQNYDLELLQPSQVGNEHAVFFVHPREKIDYQYERNPTDPRKSHTITLEVDAFGNVLRSAAIGYGRLQQDQQLSLEDQTVQAKTLVTYTENEFTNENKSIDLPDDWRTPLLWENNMYELTGDNIAQGIHFKFSEIDDATKNAIPLEYHEIPSNGFQKRLIERILTLYKKNNLEGPLPPGKSESLALPYKTYKMAFTPNLITQVYGNRVTDVMLSDRDKGKYVHIAGYDEVNWWIPSGETYFIENPATAIDELAYAKSHFFIPRRVEDPFGNNTIVKYDKYDLLVQETKDALDNTVTATTKDDAGNDIVTLDYQTLQPWLVTDPNENRSTVVFDALGRIIGTTVMGKINEPDGKPKGDLPQSFVELTDNQFNDFFADPHVYAPALLGSATTRIIYNVNSFYKTQDSNFPAYVAVLAREKHVNDLDEGEQSKIQISFTYSDGFGQEIQKAIPAEPGEISGVHVDPRWVISGWTIINNKGKPVKQYEPFFWHTHNFKFRHAAGVSATLFYDPVGRVVSTLHPNHTYEKVVFDAWHQESWDVNDTVLQLDPRNDPHVGRFFSRLHDKEYLPTWYQENRGSPVLVEQQAATKTTAHANTPTMTHLDSLGRTFLTIADNGSRGKYETFVELDVEGNQKSVMDVPVLANPNRRTVMIYDYDMLGNVTHQSSMEAGERWMLNNIINKPIYTWNSRKYILHIEYDELQRPRKIFLRNEDDDVNASEKLVEEIIYGENQSNTLNVKGKIWQHFDGAGKLTFEEYDFKGNLLSNKRDLAKDYKNTLDWSTNPKPQLEDESFITSTTYDALNRPVKQILPRNSSGTIRLTYNDAGLLERVESKLRGASAFADFVRNINYNAKGQRLFIEYGNEVVTEYDYDKNTFRLINLQTIRGRENLQDLSYTYDPIGNITHIQDNADIQKIIFFRNQRVEPSADYEYDAIYRLIKATGREHLGQNNTGALHPPTPTSYTNSTHMNLFHPNDGNAIGNYEEKYEYDPVGNIIKMIHHGTEPSYPGWTRNYAYNETSLIDNQTNNQLSSTTVRSIESYNYDAHGNMTSMPHLTMMKWDYQDQLQATSTQRVNNDSTPEITYYVYDASGQRIRKVTERYTPSRDVPRRKEERIYLGDFEIYRKYNGNPDILVLERETLHIMDDKQRIALVETRTNDTQNMDRAPSQLLRYQHNNHLGSSCLELDNDAKIISYEEYYSYGSTSYQAVQKDIDVPLKRYRYTGKERDKENGLYYHMARYYVSWLGRWSSCDPSGIVDGNNLYKYVRNNPIIFTDQNGHYSLSEFGTDVWEGVKSAVIGLAEPILVVADFGQMGSALTLEMATGEVRSPKWLSATATRIQNGDPGWRAGGVLATAIPTGGGSVLVDNVATVFEKDMNPKEARRFLVRGATAQVTAVGIASGISHISGRTPTGRGRINQDTQAAKNRIQNVIEEGGPAGGKRGIAAVEVDVPGYEGPTILRSRSGSSTPDPNAQNVPHAPVPQNRTLSTHRVSNARNQHSGSRALDAEIRGLEAVQTHLPHNAQGTIRVGSRAPLCPSCTTAVFEFIGNNPGITVEVYAPSQSVPSVGLSSGGSIGGATSLGGIGLQPINKRPN